MVGLIETISRDQEVGVVVLRIGSWNSVCSMPALRLSANTVRKKSGSPHCQRMSDIDPLVRHFKHKLEECLTKIEDCNLPWRVV